ncbi:MAG: metal ABC transporter ATP-binding protein [Cellulosilyticaceae bacterium]
MEQCRVCCTTLEAIGVKDRQNVILEAINLQIYCNEILAIIGPNGAGKTTLFRTLLGEIHHTGDVIFANDLQKHKGRPIIGYVPQQLHFDLSTPLTVEELFAICLTRRPAWLPITKAFRLEVQKALEEVGIDYVLHRQIGLLSGGELQRVLLALALLPTPQLLLLDEPVSGVDVNGQQVFYETVKKLREKYQMAIVLITHELDLLEDICDRAVLLNKQIVAEGAPAVVKEQAKGVMIWKPVRS